MANQPAENRRSIAAVNRMLRSVIEAETLEQYFWTGGLIQRFHQSDRGHCYFDLVDDKTSIRCMLREERRGDIRFDLQNGLDVEVYGDVRFYEQGSEPQIAVRDIRLTDSATAEKPVIDRLRDAGLYPPQKRPPPRRIRRIGCISGRSSRAIGDFETAYQGAGERGVLAPLSWEYVLLTGERAPQLIADAIRALDATADIDAIAILRGGGRNADFAAFESFAVAQAISQCQTFVVTGIGHHRDQTVSDQVADHAASTPTAAAYFLAKQCLRAADDFHSEAPSWPEAAEADYPPEAPGWPVAAEADYPPHAQVPPVAAASDIQPAKSNNLLNAVVIIASVFVIVACLLVLGYLLLRAGM